MCMQFYLSVYSVQNIVEVMSYFEQVTLQKESPMIQRDLWYGYLVLTVFWNRLLVTFQWCNNLRQPEDALSKLF
jgi:hypothetical protein